MLPPLEVNVVGAEAVGGAVAAGTVGDGVGWPPPGAVFGLGSVEPPTGPAVAALVAADRPTGGICTPGVPPAGAVPASGVGSGAPDDTAPGPAGPAVTGGPAPPNQ